MHLIQTQTQFKYNTQSGYSSSPPIYNHSSTTTSAIYNPSELQSSAVSPFSPAAPDTASSFAKVPRSSPYSSPSTRATPSSSSISSSKKQEFHSPLSSPIYSVQVPCVSTPWPNWDEIRTMEVKNRSNAEHISNFTKCKNLERFEESWKRNDYHKRRKT
eukprot:Awhi_evm1s6909